MEELTSHWKRILLTQERSSQSLKVKLLLSLRLVACIICIRELPKPILIIKFLEQEYSLSLYIKGYTLSQMITKVKLWDPSIWYSTDSVLDINIEVVEN